MPGRLSPARSRAVQALLVVLVMLAGGVLAGILWERGWDPPTGVVSHHRFFLDGPGLARDFSGTGLYSVVALAAGVLLGALVGLVFRRHPLTTLAAALFGAALAGWVMARVGRALGPANPDREAATAPDLTALPLDLRVHGVSPYLLLPAGALAGLAGVWLVEEAVRRFRGREGARADTVERDPAAV